MTGLVSCSIGSLMIYLTGVFETSKRSIALFWIFGMSFGLLAFLEMTILRNVFRNGLNLMMTFGLTSGNVLLVYGMPAEVSLEKKKEMIK